MKYFTLSIIAIILLQFSILAENKNGKDNFIRSTPESMGIQSKGILEFVESIEKNNIELHSFMLLRHGKVVAEAWWNPYQVDTRHIMYSVSKFFTSTAVGFAIAEKRFSLDDKVISFFPEYKQAYSENSYMMNLTVKNLLTMSAGEEPFKNFRLRDKDWIKAFLSANLNAQTSNRFIYNSYATYMVSAILQRTTKSTMLEYLKPRLFEPLGIKDILSEQSPAGITCGGWGMSVKTSDMAKLGQLYLQKGKWNGVQLLPEKWIEEASSLQIETNTKLSSTEKANSDWAQGYGYFIWRCRNNAYRADGSFGQYIIVLPDNDVVLAITANVNDMQKELQQVWNYILPAISSSKLPEDKDTYNKLTEKLSHLQLPVSPKTQKNINISETYTIAENELGIRNIALTVKNDSYNLIIRTNNATHKLVCGNNSWKHCKTDKNSPYYNATFRNPIELSPFTVAGYYTCEDDKNLVLKFVYTEDSSNETYHITIEENKIIILVSNSETPDSLPIRLVGYLD